MAGDILTRFRVAHIRQPIDPAEGQREEQIIRLVKLPSRAIGFKRRARVGSAGQHRLEHEIRSRRTEREVGMGIDVHNVERRAQLAALHARQPEIQRLVVRVKDHPRHGMRAAQPALCLQKADHLLVAVRLGAGLRRPFPQRGERAGVRQKKIHIQIEHLHRPHPPTAFLGIISSFRPTGKRLRRHVQLLLAQPVSHEALRHLADDDGFRHQHVGRHVRRLRPRRNDDADAGR